MKKQVKTQADGTKYSLMSSFALEYVIGLIHTNGIETFQSCLKRLLGGTYISVEPLHRERYFDQQSYRFNNRATKDNPLTTWIAGVLVQVSGKRLTYQQLTGKVGDTAVLTGLD